MHFFVNIWYSLAFVWVGESIRTYLLEAIPREKRNVNSCLNALVPTQQKSCKWEIAFSGTDSDILLSTGAKFKASQFTATWHLRADNLFRSQVSGKRRLWTESHFFFSACSMKVSKKSEWNGTKTWLSCRPVQPHGPVRRLAATTTWP